MINNILTVAQQVLILFILIFVGFVCGKTKLLKDTSVNGMANMILYIVTPAVIINSFQIEYQSQKLFFLLITIGITVLIHIINIALANLIIKEPDKNKSCVLKFSAVLSNCGYMALPLENALLGSDGIFYGSTFLAVFNIIIWTWGEGTMRGELKFSARQIFLNPGIIGTVVGLLLFFTSTKLPEVILTSIQHLASLNTPVPMIIIGYHLSHSKIELKNINEYIAVFYRLIACPVILLGLLLVFGIKGAPAISCIIAAGAPAAAAGTMFSERYNRNTALSATLVSVSTLLSVITMSVVVGIAQYLLT